LYDGAGNKKIEAFVHDKVLAHTDFGVAGTVDRVRRPDRYTI
jgi:hypothetical protein